MHSGNVGLSQDLETVLDAAAMFRDDPKVVFAIVGEGAAKQRLRVDVAARGSRQRRVRAVPGQGGPVRFARRGRRASRDVAPGLSGFITPSKVYGILAAGKPFIAAVDPGSEPDLIVQEHGCGWSIPPGDAAALAATIREAMGADLVSMGTRARAALETRFDRPRAATAYERLLVRVAESHH